VFEIHPFEENEARLFSQLPLEDRFMGFGAVGIFRAELSMDNFCRMWCQERKSLDSPAFRCELFALFHELRGNNGILHSCPALSDFLEHAQALAHGGKGFKIQTPGYTYCVCCRIAERCGYDITIYAYDNSFLLPELAGKHKLPDHCFSILPESGELVALQQERPHIQPFHSDGPVETRRRIANDLNEAMGVTRAQEKAMLMGCLHGFDQPCARPWQYDQNGEPRKYMKHQKDKETR